eukprot:jgi/Hompol1/471/HPOL_002502-RA
MASLVVQLGRISVPLTAKHAILEPALPAVLSFVPFQNWTRQLASQLERSSVGERIKVHSIQVSDIDYFGKRIGFVKFAADIRWIDDGQPLPGIVFCRGGAVAVLLIVRPTGAAKASEASSSDDAYVVLTVQPRLPIAALEEAALPAGMLDGDRNFAGVAAKELEEECGIKISSNDLIDLTGHRTVDEVGLADDEFNPATTGLFPSAGGCDEFIRLFLCEKEMPLEQIRQLEGREAGLRDEGERISVRIVPLRDLWRSTRDMKALAALALYQQYKSQ